MPEAREPRSIIEAAEQAAAAGNYASAEELLREAALLQEASLGPFHPDLANTLNNLGVVCEITGNLPDAEHFFRRAFTIATTVLEPDHPFVATTRTNLCDFCEARGKSIQCPTSSPAVTPKLEAQATASVDPPRESQLPRESQNLQQLARRTSFRPLAIGALSAAAALIVILAMARPWSTSTEPAKSSSMIAIDHTREIPAPPHAPLPVERVPVPAEIMKTARSASDGVRITAATHARPTVVRARLCADLDEWQCDPADRPVPPGPLFFYTQVRSTSATTIHHRWYRGDRLYQSVTFRVEATPSVGYRTQSRYTMTSDSAGSWRVELRAEDGALLHEERFSVR